MVKNVNENEFYLDFRTSFFKLWLVRGGDIVVFVYSFFGFIATMICVAIQMHDYGVGCNSKNFTKLDDPDCHILWILYGPNQLIFLTMLFFLLSFTNSIVYRDGDTFLDCNSVSLVIQWVLFSICLPLSAVSAFAFETNLSIEHTVYPSMEWSQWTNFGLLTLFGVLCNYEFEYRHVILSTLVLFLHYLIFAILFKASGVDLYPSHKSQQVVYHLPTFGMYLIISILYHTAWVAYQKLKLKNVYGDQGLWISKFPVEMHKLTATVDAAADKEEA
jgi:hypothetical protein